MSDHREPVSTVSIPSPSSANVPCIQESEQTTASFDKENVNSAVQTPNTINDDKLESNKTALAAVNPSTQGESSSSDQSSAQAFPHTALIETSPCGAESNFQEPKNAFCHSLTSVVPILTQAPASSSVLSPGSSVAHPVTSLLPNIASTVAPSSTNTGAPTNVLKINTATNLQQPLRTLGTSSRPKLPVEESIPDVIPDFLPGKIDAKKFPARHFELGTLEIGTWKYDSKPNGSFFPTTSRLKVIFSQKKFVYEFQQRSSSTAEIINMFQKEKMMACIEVPFASIVGINMSRESPCHVLIEVKSPPFMYVGKQSLCASSTGCALPTKYDTSKSVDLTEGQLMTIPYHKLRLNNNHMRSKLESFDPRFDALLRTPIIMDLTKRLPVLASVQPTKHRTPHSHAGSSAPKKSRKLKSPSSSISGDATSMCSCTLGCNKGKCGCLRNNGKCGSECKCGTCENPLNILADNGVNIEEAKKDVCLMDNITKIKDLDKFMKKSKISTPCCDANISMKDVCEGIVSCPECEDGEYRFSWCDSSFHDDDCRPRNHCPICKTCGDYRDEHCFKCNKCYFAGSSGSFRCPCDEKSMIFMDVLSSFLSELHGPDSDDEYY